MYKKNIFSYLLDNFMMCFIFILPASIFFSLSKRRFLIVCCSLAVPFASNAILFVSKEFIKKFIWLQVSEWEEKVTFYEIKKRNKNNCVCGEWSINRFIRWRRGKKVSLDHCRRKKDRLIFVCHTIITYRFLVCSFISFTSMHFDLLNRTARKYN